MTGKLEETGELEEEAPLDPARPIIDPHLHLWEILADPTGVRQAQRFLIHEAAETIRRSGHRITHTVFVQCHAMHRAGGPPELSPVGETEFVAGQAAMSDSGNYGETRISHRIVGTADLLLGERVAPVLEAHVAAGGGRFRGIRMGTAWTAETMFGRPCDPAGQGIVARPEFLAGARALAAMGLSLDVWCFHTQLGELIDLATALPDLTIVLDHVGTPECIGSWAGRSEEARSQWAAAIAGLAQRPNVAIKLGGLGMNLQKSVGSERLGLSSTRLAERWRPWLEPCIEAFTPARAMFESNFPPDNDSGSYGATWNAFKIISASYSETEKDDLFRRTAARTYQIALD